MGRRARVIVLSSAAALVACNALTGADDLQLDGDPATSRPEAGAADTTPAKPSEAGATAADAATDAAADADAAPCIVDPMAKLESITGAPTLAVDDAKVGSVPWMIGGAGTGARATLSATQITHYLRSYGFNFGMTVPQDAVIRGFQVTITRTADFPDEVTDYGVVLVKDGVPGGASKTSGTTWESLGNTRAATYGSASDLWLDPSWTTSDLRNPSFGVALAARGLGAAMTTAQVTALTLTVTFVRCTAP